MGYRGRGFSVSLPSGWSLYDLGVNRRSLNGPTRMLA
jgi:hypothetical protein